ncbi:predicted protein [Histoplasma mississippiense (nom. inval.)]|uniref:predicted protein n=1 Tax=Ajellomyces capsulatus (strain NAm1 / WU24) TaxID=2059318 RepID=UPI000157B9F7|nr:predicted protein [Histoplasma mississippiense (nom. inval.)]EDN03609.1 predicted protein [Histoplasma mississippiense (nom. inval.)]
MPLSVLVERDILLISEGRSGVDNVYTLHNGVLRLELDKNSFERAGLDGKPNPVVEGENTSRRDTPWKSTLGSHQCFMGRRASSGSFGLSRTY